jgi:predicted nucleotidyltransferase
MYELILKDFGYEDDNVLCVFPYGSRVYGNNKPDSDYDYILVMKKVVTESDRLDSRDNPISITTYSEQAFKERINEHKIFALECIFCPEKQILKNKLNFQFKLNKSNLRHSISEKCSKDWNQAKKRFSNSQDINPVTGERYLRKVYEGKKSLFHCFRMIDFANQIIEKGKIENFGSCNELWEELYTDPSEEWNYYDNKYYNDYNNRLIEFRKLAPK